MAKKTSLPVRDDDQPLGDYVDAFEAAQTIVARRMGLMFEIAHEASSRSNLQNKPNDHPAKKTKKTASAS